MYLNCLCTIQCRPTQICTIAYVYFAFAIGLYDWLPQASHTCGKFSDTSCLKFSTSKGSIGYASTIRIPRITVPNSPPPLETATSQICVSRKWSPPAGNVTEARHSGLAAIINIYTHTHCSYYRCGNLIDVRHQRKPSMSTIHGFAASIDIMASYELRNNDNNNNNVNTRTC